MPNPLKGLKVNNQETLAGRIGNPFGQPTSVPVAEEAMVAPPMPMSVEDAVDQSQLETAKAWFAKHGSLPPGVPENIAAQVMPKQPPAMDMPVMADPMSPEDAELQMRQQAIKAAKDAMAKKRGRVGQ